MTKRFPTPDYHFSYRIPPVSGNTINGLGETSPRRARQVFHGSGARKLEWVALEMFFGLTMPLHIFIRNALNRWELRKADGPLAQKRTPVLDSAEMSKQIKSIQVKGIRVRNVFLVEMHYDICYCWSEEERMNVTCFGVAGPPPVHVLGGGSGIAVSLSGRFRILQFFENSSQTRI